MRDALVFDGASNLNFQDIRVNVVRIPEVVNRIREAQEIWDKISSVPLDLSNFIASDDDVFLSHIKLKNFATAVVQVGLMDRYLKYQKLPEFIVGAVNGDSPLKVISGQTTFADLVKDSPAINNQFRSVKAVVQSALDLPLLSGVELVEFAVFHMNPVTGDYERVISDSRDLEQMLTEIIENLDVTRLIMVGPGYSISSRKVKSLTNREINVQESIDLDPMLSWFWAGSASSYRTHLGVQ